MQLRSPHRAGRALVHVLLIVAIGGGIGLADLALRKDRVSLARKAPPPPPPVETPKSAEKAPEPDAIDAKAEIGGGAATGGVPEAAAIKQPEPARPPGAALPPGHITIAQAQQLYDDGAFFVDARKKELYVAGHVANAFRADMASFRTGDPAWVGALPKDLVLVVYCGGGDCDESEHVAQLLEASGFRTIYVMHDGFPGWQAAGLPVETGEGQE